MNQEDATALQVYYFMFMCASTCFGRLSAHHQERTTALGASGFTVGAWCLERCWSSSGRLCGDGDSDIILSLNSLYYILNKTMYG